MAELIDAHQHFWQIGGPFQYRWLDAPAMTPIRRSFLPEHLEPLLRQVGVARTILVQTQHDLDENRWALELAGRHAFIAGVVAWIDLTSSDCEQQLCDLLQHRAFVGVRHIIQDEPDDEWILRNDVMRGLALLERRRVPFDLLFHTRHLHHAATVARNLPDLPLVIDHLAKPRIRKRRFDDWIASLRDASSCANVYCKLSGLVTEADWANWSPADLRPYVSEAVEAFGPRRCMFGSDWPVCELAGDYRRVYEALVSAIGPVSETEKGEILGGTAARFYGLSADEPEIRAVAC